MCFSFCFLPSEATVFPFIPSQKKRLKRLFFSRYAYKISPDRESKCRSKINIRSESLDHTLHLGQRSAYRPTRRVRNDFNFKSRSPTVQPQVKSPQPKFKYKRNKIQDELNVKVLDKIEEAVLATDETERKKALAEGKKILKERNKHI